MVENKEEIREVLLDRIENIMVDIKNVEYDENASLIAALDFAEENLYEIVKDIEELIE